MMCYNFSIWNEKWKIIFDVGNENLFHVTGIKFSRRELSNPLFVLRRRLTIAINMFNNFSLAAFWLHCLPFNGIFMVLCIKYALIQLQRYIHRDGERERKGLLLLLVDGHLLKALCINRLDTFNSIEQISLSTLRLYMDKHRIAC